MHEYTSQKRVSNPTQNALLSQRSEKLRESGLGLGKTVLRSRSRSAGLSHCEPRKVPNRTRLLEPHNQL